MTRPRLAIGIPAYNQPDFLREALTSLCDQGLPREDYAVAVADDASPTPLAEVVDGFRDRLQIVYHRLAANVGHLANWDAAWQLVDAPFISFLAHDDVVAPGHFARALAVIEPDADAVLVASLALKQSHPGALNTHLQGMLLGGAGRASFTRPYRWDRTEWMALGLVATPNSIVGSVFRTEAFRRCRTWTSYPIWHDRLMLAEMGLHGTVLTLPWIAGHYRTGEWQLSGRIWHEGLGEFAKATAAVFAWCSANNIDVIRFWIDQICTAPEGDRLLYLQMIRSALEPAVFEDIKRQCEARLNMRLPLGRLERLGIPAPVVALLRGVDRRLSRRT